MIYNSFGKSKLNLFLEKVFVLVCALGGFIQQWRCPGAGNIMRMS
ncbi:unnamed protein product [Tenebrio molitor]|nr:unnamed protein product [Tenebrio molitor]